MNHPSKNFLVWILLIIIAFLVGAFGFYVYKDIKSEEKVILGTRYYLGQYQGKDVISSLDSEESNPGYLNFPDGGGMALPDKRQFEYPTQILKSESERYASLNILGFTIDEKRENIYVSFSVGTIDQTFNKIVKTNLVTLEEEEVHSHLVGDSTYPEKGAFFSPSIHGEWLILSLTHCFYCEGRIWSKVLLNVSTGKERYLGHVDNVKVQGDTVSYQKLETTEVLCEAKDWEGELSPCDPQTKMKRIEVLAGQVIEEKL